MMNHVGIKTSWAILLYIFLKQIENTHKNIMDNLCKRKLRIKGCSVQKEHDGVNKVVSNHPE